MTHRTLVLLATATLWALPAAANPAASYAEAAAGLSRGSVDCTGTSQCDRSSSFGRLTVGHEFAPGLAAEFSLGKWGTLQAAGDLPGIGRVQARVQARGVGLGLASSTALGSGWALTARLGVASNQARITGTALGSTTRNSERSTVPYAGLGLRYRLGDRVSIGAQVDRTRVTAEGDKATLTMTGVSLRMALG